jgi:hypothetical protein
MLNEAFRVARLAGPDTKVILDIGERADATRQLDKNPPSRRWKMNQWHPAPARGECPAENGKQDKCQVQQQNTVSGKLSVHEKPDTIIDSQSNMSFVNCQWLLAFRTIILCLVCLYSNSGVVGSFLQKMREVVTMQGQTGRGPTVADAATDADARVCLLAEVDFKWLMAGQGRWIDTTRFHRDPSYAAGLIRWALASPSFALRECAALLQAEIGGPASCGTGESPPPYYAV